MNLLTQELFDDALVENEECFDLSPKEALVETIDQLIKQCRQQRRSTKPLNSPKNDVFMYLGNLLLSHPASEQGRKDREKRKMFLNCLKELDHCVRSISNSNSKFDAFPDGERSQKIIYMVKYIQESCSVSIHLLSSDLEFDDSGVAAEVHPHASKTAEEDSAQPHIEYGALETNPRRVYLNLFQTQGGMDIFVALLRVTTMPANLATIKAHAQVTEAVVSCMVEILKQEQYPETMLIIASFSAWDQITTLLEGIGGIFHLWSASLKDASSEKKVFGEPSIEALINIFPKVYQLCCIACKGYEKNKVQFVQSRSYLLACDNDEIEDVEGKTKKRNSILIIIQTLDSFAFLFQGPFIPCVWSSEQGLFTLRTLSRICNVVAAVCRCDDKNSQVSSAHDHAMEFYRAGVTKVLHNIATRVLYFLDKVTHQDDPLNADINRENDVVVIGDVDPLVLVLLQLLCSIMAAVRVTCINDEIVQSWVSFGLLCTIQRVLAFTGSSSTAVEAKNAGGMMVSPHLLEGGTKVQLLSDAMGVIRNICGNDDIKTAICQDGKTLPLLLIHGMRQFRSVSTVQEHGCGIVAAMALRSVPNTQRMMAEYDVGKDIIAALRCHPTNSKVQRQGALAIRNLASRGDVAVKEALIDLGVEELLRNTTGQLPDSVEEAYAALRDLGFQVSLIHYTLDNDGKVIRGGTVQMFGEVEPKFRATFEPTDDIEEMISYQAARNEEKY